MKADDVPSLAMTKDLVYGAHRRPLISSGRYWRRKLPPRKPPGFVRNKDNYWQNIFNYFIYAILRGNGVDGFPIVFRFSLEVSGVALICLLIMYSILFVTPITYVEIFLGKYTKMTNGQIYRMTPLFFGFSVLVFLINMINAPIRSVDISVFLVAAMEVLIDPTYGKRCPVDSDGCVENMRIFSNASRHQCNYEFMSAKIDGKQYRYIHEYLYWKRFKDENSRYPIATYIVANMATWFFIILLCLLGMRLLGLVLRGTFVIHTVIYTIIFLMAMTAEGALGGLERLAELKLNKPRLSKVLMIGFFTTWKMGVIVPTGYMTNAACTNFKTNIGTANESLIITLCNNALTIYYMIIIYAIGGVLMQNMGLTLECIIVPFAGFYYAMIPQFLQIRESPKIILAIFHLGNWFLEIVRLALDLHLLVLNIYDFFPLLAKYQAYVKMTVGLISAVMGMGACSKVFAVEFIPVYAVLCFYFLQGLCLLIMSVMVFYFYGVNRLSDDIHFISGRRPITLWRVLWFFYPILVLIFSVLIGIDVYAPKEFVSSLRNDLPKRPFGGKIDLRTLGYILCAIYAVIIIFGTVFYIFASKSSSAVMTLLNPQFHWGPPNKEQRVLRKSFAPRTSIRSQPLRTKKQRYRVKSIKQMRDKDAVDHKYSGMIFMDAMFFSNIGDDTFQDRAYRKRLQT